MFENRFGSTDTFKMAADQRKIACAIFFQNAVSLEIIVGIAPYLEHRRTLGAFLYIDLGVTSRDLAMT